MSGGVIAWLVAALTLEGARGQDIPPAVSRDDGAPSARRPVVCLLLPLSGPHEALGRRVERVIRGVLEGEPVSVRALDDHDPAGSASVVGRARDAGCDLAIGGIGDLESRTLSEAAESVRMPLLALGRAPDEKTRDHVIRVRTPRTDPVVATARHAIERERRMEAHVLVPDHPYGREVARAFGAAFEAGGGRVRSERAVPAGEDLAKTAETFAATRTATFGGGPARDAAPMTACDREVLFLGFDLISARRLVSLIEFEGVPVRGGEATACPPILILGTGVWNDPARVSRLGDDLDGARFADVALAEGERDVLEAEVRDAALLALALLKNHGSVRDGLSEGEARDPGAIGRWAEGLRFRGATGDLEVRGGQVMGRTLAVFEIRDGEIRPVTDGPEP